MGKKIKLVLSGSGTKYPVHAGGIKRLLEEGYEIEEICGTSGGAIIGAGIASGYKVGEELEGLMKELLPRNNNLISFSLWSLITKWGLIDGEKIEKLFLERAVPTFKDTVIPLHIVTTNVERRACRIFSTASDPDASVARAVRASMSIPGIFTPVRIEDELYVDGGLVGNFILDIFDDSKNVVGLYFGPSRISRDWKSQKRIPIKGAAEFVTANISSMMMATTREHIDDAVYAKAIPLISSYGGLRLNMDENDIDHMIQEGYDSVDNWLKAHKLNIS